MDGTKNEVVFINGAATVQITKAYRSRQHSSTLFIASTSSKKEKKEKAAAVPVHYDRSGRVVMDISLFFFNKYKREIERKREREP